MALHPSESFSVFATEALTAAPVYQMVSRVPDGRTWLPCYWVSRSRDCIGREKFDNLWIKWPHVVGVGRTDWEPLTNGFRVMRAALPYGRGSVTLLQ